MPKPTTLMTTTEVVAYLAERGIQVSDETIYRRVKSGALKAKRVGGFTRPRLRFERADVDALLVEDGAA